jgi:hypothetical protein
MVTYEKLTKMFIKILKISIKIANVLVIIGALGVLGYYFGLKKYEQKVYQKGVNDVLGAIVNQIQQLGQVKIGDIILIEKK